MTPILLALHLTLTNGVCQLRTVTPGVGSYSVQMATTNLLHWRVLQAKSVTNAVHVTASVPAGEGCAFFRVEWR